MAYNSLAELFTAIANSIRGKTGGTEKIVANDFPAAIDGISSGGADDWYITDASYLFYNGARLDAKDVLLAKCKGMTNMNSMFYGCKSLTSLDVSNIDVSKVSNMTSVFFMCSNLTSLDLSSWDTSGMTSVYNMQNMFSSCNQLAEIIGFSATGNTGIVITFPVGNSSKPSALKRLTFRTDLPDGVYSIRSPIDIKRCSFERDGMVEMFNTLPDVSGLTHAASFKTITITGNPCVTNATLTAEDEAIATAKGWTLVK